MEELSKTSKSKSDKTISDKTISDKTIFNKTIFDKTIADKTKSDKTKLDKIKSDKIKKFVRFDSSISANTNINDSDEIDELNDISDSDEEDLIIDKDPTDIYESDEEEILNNDLTDIFSDLVDEPNKDTIKYIYNIFLQKHEHLDNYINRSIILKLCLIAVNCMPEHISNPKFYLNFIESSIVQLKNTTVEDIQKTTSKDINDQ